MKHIYVKFHFVREILEEGDIELQNIHTKDFHYAWSQWITPWCRNTYNPSDSLVSYTRKLHKLAEAAPQNNRVRTRTQNNADTHVRLLKVTNEVFGDHNTLIT